MREPQPSVFMDPDVRQDDQLTRTPAANCRALLPGSSLVPGGVGGSWGGGVRARGIASGFVAARGIAAGRRRALGGRGRDGQGAAMLVEEEQDVGAVL